MAWNGLALHFQKNEAAKTTPIAPAFGYPTSVLRSAAVRRFNIIRYLYLSPRNNSPCVLLVIRTDHARVLAITRVCMFSLNNKQMGND
jgi:hypothetical protein